MYFLQLVQLAELILANSPNEFPSTRRIYFRQLAEFGISLVSTLSNKIDTTKMKAPSFMMVLTAVGKYAFRRDDSVYVVPIGCLKD